MAARCPPTQPRPREAAEYARTSNGVPIEAPSPRYSTLRRAAQ